MGRNVFRRGFVQKEATTELTRTMHNDLYQTGGEEKDDEYKSEEEEGSKANCKEHDEGHPVGGSV